MTEKTLTIGGTIFKIKEVTLSREIVEIENAPGQFTRVPTGNLLFYGTLEDGEAKE